MFHGGGRILAHLRSNLKPYRLNAGTLGPAKPSRAVERAPRPSLASQQFIDNHGYCGAKSARRLITNKEVSEQKTSI